MFRDRLHLLPLLAVLFILGACQSEGKLTGEVFIVTKGRDNIEMGLVDVKAFKASSLEEYLEVRHRKSKEKVQLRVQKAAAQLDSLSLAQETLRERKAEYKAAQAEYSEAKEKYQLSSKIINTPLQASRGDRVELFVGDELKLFNTTSSTSVKGYMSNGDVGTILDVKSAEINTYYKIKSSDGEVGWTPFHNRFMEVSNESVLLRKKSKEKMERKKRLLEEANLISRNVSTSLRNTLGQIASYRGQEYYFRNIPQPAKSDETGSDGNYELTVEGGVPYYLVAQASRSVGDEEEQYYWMVKTTVDGGGEKEVNLTNENLGGVADKGYALSERTLSTVRGIWNSSISLAKQGEELDWEKLIYRTAFPKDTTDAPIPDDLDVPEEKLLSDR